MQTFSELNIHPALSKCLDKIGFVKPTLIQQKAIPAMLENRDLMACAETGSGKTGAYLIPMIMKLLDNPNSHGLILAPTRELAQQIFEFAETLISDPRHIHVVKLVGGSDIRRQFKQLQKKPRIIIATPGRLIDHLKRNTAQIHKVDQLVLDEGDRMIDMGFAPQLEDILKFLVSERQTSFFTATLDKKVQNLAAKYINNPVTLMLDNPRPVSTIKQSVVQVETKDKDKCMLDELNARKGSVIVFVKTKHKTDKLNKYLKEYGFASDSIHGGRSQGQRNNAIRAFKNGETRILCATDVAARGLDVPHVEHVINFDIPMQDEDYVHRVGRTARNGAEGEAVSFVTSQESRAWNRLAKKYQINDCMIEGVTAAGESEGRSFRGRGRSNAKSGRKPFGRKPFGKKASDESGEGRKPYGRKPFGKKSSDEAGEGSKSYGKKSYGKKAYGKKSSDEAGEGRKSFGKKKFAAKKSGGKKFGKKFGGKSFGNKKSGGFKSRGKSYSSGAQA